MNVTDLRHSAPSVTGYTAGRINQFIHRLQRCGAIPNNGAGRQAAEIDAKHVAAFLVAVAIEGDPETAVEHLPRWLAMPSHAGGVPFGEELRRILSTHPNDVREVRVGRRWPHATVLRDDGSATEYGDADPAAPLTAELVFRGGALDLLAGEFRETHGAWGRP